MKSNKIMGRDVARKRNHEETFSDEEIANNQHRFREIKEVLKLDDADSGFFDELVLLIGDCRGFDALIGHNSFTCSPAPKLTIKFGLYVETIARAGFSGIRLDIGA